MSDFLRSDGSKRKAKKKEKGVKKAKISAPTLKQYDPDPLEPSSEDSDSSDEDSSSDAGGKGSGEEIAKEDVGTLKGWQKFGKFDYKLEPGTVKLSIQNNEFATLSNLGLNQLALKKEITTSNSYLNNTMKKLNKHTRVTIPNKGEVTVSDLHYPPDVWDVSDEAKSYMKKIRKSMEKTYAQTGMKYASEKVKKSRIYPLLTGSNGDIKICLDMRRKKDAKMMDDIPPAVNFSPTVIAGGASITAKEPEKIKTSKEEDKEEKEPEEIMSDEDVAVFCSQWMQNIDKRKSSRGSKLKSEDCLTELIRLNDFFVKSRYSARKDVTSENIKSFKNRLKDFIEPTLVDRFVSL